MSTNNPKLTAAEIAALFSDPHWAAKYPPILSLDQAAELIQVPKATLYAWSSQGLLDKCRFKAGKHIRINRAQFISQLVNEGFR